MGKTDFGSNQSIADAEHKDNELDRRMPGAGE
jgi:hypothetical protein